ncbi:MAG: hypothetical protein M1514_01190 [Patescibacteria group bacterium]|nr:hypothetical protein [Patescibacteria group bacterium]
MPNDLAEKVKDLEKRVEVLEKIVLRPGFQIYDAEEKDKPKKNKNENFCHG